MKLQKLGFNALREEKLKDVPVEKVFQLHILPEMPPEIKAVAEEANTLLIQIATMENALNADVISEMEYDLYSDDVQRWRDRIQVCMGTYNSYLQGTNAPIGR